MICTPASRAKTGCLFSHWISPCIHLSHSNFPFPLAPGRLPIPYTTLISLGDRMRTLPKEAASCSALVAAEAVTPRAVPTPEAKRVGLCLGSHSSGTSSSFVPQHGTSKSSTLPGRVCNWLFHPALPLHQGCCQTP